MADLFDVSVGGVGWHFTSHLIALAALFIACFAIAGYITFRSDSIPGDALKDHDVDVEDIVADSVTTSGDVTVGGFITSADANVNHGGYKIIFGSSASTTVASTVPMVVTQPANTTLVNAGFYCLETTAAATANTNTGMMVGTQAAGNGVGGEICALVADSFENTNNTADGITQGNCQVVAGDIGMSGVGNAADLTFVNNTITSTTSTRQVHITLVSSANDTANALDAGTAPEFAGSTNIGGNFAAVTNALLPFIVVKKTPVLPAGVATTAEIGLFNTALTDL